MASEPGKPNFPPPLPNPAADEISPEIPATQSKQANEKDETIISLEPPPDSWVASDQGKAPAPPPSISANRTLKNNKFHSRPKPQEPTPLFRSPAPAPSQEMPTVLLSPTVLQEKLRTPDLGVLEQFLKDPEVTEILVNDVRNIIIERNGEMELAQTAVLGLEELNRIVRAILDTTGALLTPEQPFIELMLPNGARVNLVAPPLAPEGPCITIHKAPLQTLNINNLIQLESMDHKIAHFLKFCILGKMNILILGGAGSGKTALLNALLQLIPSTERIITIEDMPELSLFHPNSVKFQTKPPTPTTRGITARELLVHSLRMRPDRIILGQCRGAEALDLLDAMDSGCSGSMATLNANTPAEGLNRFEAFCKLSSTGYYKAATRRQIANSIDLIIQLKRLRSGQRKVVSVSQVTGPQEESEFFIQDIFLFESTENTPEDGIFKPTGFVPKFLERLDQEGIKIPRAIFDT